MGCSRPLKGHSSVVPNQKGADRGDEVLTKAESICTPDLLQNNIALWAAVYTAIPHPLRIRRARQHVDEGKIHRTTGFSNTSLCICYSHISSTLLTTKETGLMGSLGVTYALHGLGGFPLLGGYLGGMGRTGALVEGDYI